MRPTGDAIQDPSGSKNLAQWEWKDLFIFLTWKNHSFFCLLQATILFSVLLPRDVCLNPAVPVSNSPSPLRHSRNLSRRAGPYCGAKWQNFLQSMSIKLPASDTLRTKAWIPQLFSGREFNIPLARVETKNSTILGCYDSLLPQQYCLISRLFRSWNLFIIGMLCSMAILICESFLRGGDVESSKLSLADVVGSGDRWYRAPEVKALAFRTVSQALVNSFQWRDSSHRSRSCAIISSWRTPENNSES